MPPTATPPRTSTGPTADASGAALHYAALEALYASAPVNALFESRLTITGEGHSRIDFAVDQRVHHAAHAAHGTIYFKMLDDAAFYAANSLVTDRFLLTTAFQPALHQADPQRPGGRRRALDQRPPQGVRRRSQPDRRGRRRDRPRHRHFHALAHSAVELVRLSNRAVSLAMEPRLPAHIEVNGLLRAVEAAGGFATVIAKGERDAGTLLVTCCEQGQNCRAYERMPRPDGTRAWTLTKTQDPGNPVEFQDYLDRRKRQDSDLWIVELDIPDAERFIASTGTRS